MSIKVTYRDGVFEPLDKVVRALRAPDRQLHFVYEAGPCGYGIQRWLSATGHACVVVAPSLIPRRPGDPCN